MTEAVKIASLQLENVKRVQLVELTPTPEGLTVIGGNNAQGKTSILDGIVYALGGERYRPSNLAREGGMADPRICLTLSNGIKVERKGKNSALTVTDPEGRKGGQKLLDSFVEPLALNTPKFLAMDGREKASVLLQIIGIGDKLADLDKEERKVYEERLLQGRVADQKLKFWRELPEHHDVPEVPLSASDLVSELNGIASRNASREKAAAELERMQTQLDTLLEQIEDLKKLSEKVAIQIVESQKVVDSIGGMEDAGDLKARMDALEETNAKVRANADKAKAKDDSDHAAEIVAAMSSKLEEVRARRMALLDGAEMPLPGLSVSDGQLTYNGKAWDCMSSSEQVKAAIAIVRKLKPECGFVLLDRLECFDNLQLVELAGWIKEQGLQAIATRVSTGGECTIIIEDGLVSSSSVETKKEETKEEREVSWE